ARLMSAELLMSTSLAQRAQLTQPPTASLMDRVRFDMSVAAAEYAYRAGARQEQIRVYELASYYSVECSVIPLLPASISTPVEDVGGTKAREEAGGPPTARSWPPPAPWSTPARRTTCAPRSSTTTWTSTT